MSHIFPVTVYYEDTDMGGIVYHANYLRFIERARSDYVRQLGVDQNALRADGAVFVVSRIEADFRATARFEDQLQVETTVAQTTSARMVLGQVVRRAEQLLFEARVTVVCMDMQTGKPKRLPAELRASP